MAILFRQNIVKGYTDFSNFRDSTSKLKAP
jgi:hypothetical protein